MNNLQMAAIQIKCFHNILWPHHGRMRQPQGRRIGSKLLPWWSHFAFQSQKVQYLTIY
jgi:hypothetical protein